MLPTANNSSPIPHKNEGFEVLNISNVNAQNEIVLNDEQLLALIQQYPFLFNPHVRPHNDIDYDAWAWEQITKSFNRTYENDRNVWFTTLELIERWKVLQPIVRSLSKFNNMKSLPDTLRQTVVKMSVPMEEKPNEMHKKAMTVAQKTLLEYESLVNSLPISERRRLEAEMMELILSSELESKATIKLGFNELQAIENEYNDFLKTIGLHDLYFVEENSNGSEQSSNNSEDIPRMFQATTTSNCIAANDLLSSRNVERTDLRAGIGYRIDDTASISETTDDALEVAADTILCEKNGIFEVDPNVLEVVDESSIIDMKLELEAEDSLLKPLVSRWVPLMDWRQYVRKCRVRIKRTVFEDDIPLAVIKREKFSKDPN